MSNSDLDYGGGKSPPAIQKPIPSEGLHDALCFASVNWGDALNFDETDVYPHVRFFYELDEKMPAIWIAPDGKEIAVDGKYVGKRFVLSTYPIPIKYGQNSKYVTTMKEWLGARDCPPSLVGYPLGGMRAKMAALAVQWKTRDDGTYLAFIKGVSRARAGATPWVAENNKLADWVLEAREKDNEKAARFLAARALRAADADDPSPADTEIPF